MESVLNITFGEPASSRYASLLLEQEEWSKTTGILTKAGLYSLLKNVLMNQSGENYVDCGISEDGSIQSSIHAYPNPVGLSYSLKTSYGTLSDRSITTYTQEETIKFSVSSSASCKYYFNTIPTYNWVGTVRDSKGNDISSPEVFFGTDRTIRLAKKVYGLLKISYEVVQHSYTLTAYAREDSDSDLFGAVVYGVYSGGVSWVEITNPPNVDDLAADLECGWNVEWPEDEESPFNAPKYATTVDEVLTFDYCSGELINYSKGARV